jgi:hypothetical protein
MMLKGLAMNHTSIQTLVANLVYYSVELEHLSALDCRACSTLLDIHQPNQNQPDQFLGTCGNCGRWYRVESLEEVGRITVLELPDVSETKPGGKAPGSKV